jgi:hypothetical protein
MNYLVLFSVMLIAASVVILLLPSNHTEGVAPRRRHASKAHAAAQPAQPAQPVAAGQRNASGNAGSADGTSDHDHLLNTLLLKHDKLAEAFENRKKTNRDGVSSTTTKKKGIASTGDNVNVPVAGCNKNKCVEIGPTATDGQGNLIAFSGNCVNPKYYNSDYVNYRIKYCPAFKPADDTIDDQECETCGYYTYYGICIKKDPNKDVDPTDPNWAPTPKNPSNCEYRDYQFNKFNYGPMPGTTGNDGGDQGSSGPNCSTCQLDTTTVNKCVLPGCYSADDGNLPFPDDGDYNFAEGCFDYNPTSKPLPGMENRPAGYYCPPITPGQSYDGGGSSGDQCYTTNSALDYSKFRLMKTTCSNDKQPSEQKFVPGKDAPIDGNDMPPPRNTKHRSASKTGATTSAIQHQHGGAVNVYHHHMNSSGSKNMNGGKNTNMSGSKNTNKNQGYMEPEAGASVLGFL